MRIVLAAVLICGLVADLAVAAEVYRSTDKDGNVIFSDQGSPDAERIDIPETNTLPTTRTRPSTNSRGEATAPAGVYEQVSILSPLPDQALVTTGGHISVNVVTEPALRRGHYLEVLVDGNVAASGESGQFNLSGVLRGTHNLSARVIDQDNEVAAASPVIQFHIIIPGGAGRAL